MHQEHPSHSRALATITALPWLVIWIAAVITLSQKRMSDIPFEYPLAWLLAIASPLMAWHLFRR
jgi:hypothetical protein